MSLRTRFNSFDIFPHLSYEFWKFVREKNVEVLYLGEIKKS